MLTYPELKEPRGGVQPGRGPGCGAPPNLSRCPGSLRNPAQSSPLNTASRGSQCADSCPDGTTCNTEEGQGVAGQSLFSGRTENPLISHHPETYVSKDSNFNSGLVITFSHLHSPCTHPQFSLTSRQKPHGVNRKHSGGAITRKGALNPKSPCAFLGENSHSAIFILLSWPGLHGLLTRRGGIKDREGHSGLQLVYEPIQSLSSAPVKLPAQRSPTFGLCAVEKGVGAEDSRGRSNCLLRIK